MTGVPQELRIVTRSRRLVQGAEDQDKPSGYFPPAHEASLLCAAPVGVACRCVLRPDADQEPRVFPT